SRRGRTSFGKGAQDRLIQSRVAPGLSREAHTGFYKGGRKKIISSPPLVEASVNLPGQARGISMRAVPPWPALPTVTLWNHRLPETWHESGHSAAGAAGLAGAALPGVCGGGPAGTRAPPPGPLDQPGRGPGLPAGGPGPGRAVRAPATGTRSRGARARGPART